MQRVPDPNTNLRYALLFLALLFPWAANAHVGSPDVFFDGLVGPYPARITIRMPGVVPGRAEIFVRILSAPPDNPSRVTHHESTASPLAVSFLPLYSRTAASNAPPADLGQLVPGETNLYSGELWLMSFGAYSIEVRIRGQAGEGAVEIPVNSVATRQLPLPPYLGKILLVLAAILVFGGIGIVAAAVRESVLPPGASPDSKQRRRGWRAAALTAVLVTVALAGGKRWWQAEERHFRQHLRQGAWPDLGADVRVEGRQRILRLTLGRQAFGPDYFIPLLPDHGKLLHLFLAREPNHDAFGHLHPVRTGNESFDVVLPPLPEGEYTVYCDLTLENSAMSSTAVASVRIPPVPDASADASSARSDPDDSWAAASVLAVPVAANTDTLCSLAGGEQVVWKAHPSLRVKQEASLRFEVRDAAGRPLLLEPYMGMMSHAAVLRSDDAVFAHLHPSGNYSMAAQSFFDDKMEREAVGQASSLSPAPHVLGPASSLSAGREAGAASDVAASALIDHSAMHHHHAAGGSADIISLPYEFPTAGNYRLWVQFKAEGKVLTAVFDAAVATD